MQQDVETQVIHRVAEMAGVEPGEVTLTSAFADLGVDSLSAVSLIGDLEDEFGVSIPNDEVIRIRTVSDAVTQIVRAMAEGGQA